MNKKSNATNFSYWSLGLFSLSVFLSFVSQDLGGLGMLGSSYLGVIAVVLGLVEKNKKAWALGLIAPVLFFILAVIGLMIQ